MMSNQKIPRSPKDEIEGLIYFPRLCNKVRLFASGELHPDYHPNLGRAMDLWACQLLNVEYDELKKVILDGASDEEALQWAFGKSGRPAEHLIEWWTSYMRNRGFRDDLSDKLVIRKKEAGLAHCDELVSFMDFIDAEEEGLR